MATAVNLVSGIGPKTAAYLTEQGIESAEALLAADAAILIAAPGFSEGRANNVLEAARELLGGVSPQSANTPAKPQKAKKDKKSGDKKKKDAKDKKSGKKAKKGDKKKNKKEKKKGDKKGKKKKK